MDKKFFWSVVIFMSIMLTLEIVSAIVYIIPSFMVGLFFHTIPLLACFIFARSDNFWKGFAKGSITGFVLFSFYYAVYFIVEMAMGGEGHAALGFVIAFIPMAITLALLGLASSYYWKKIDSRK